MHAEANHDRPHAAELAEKADVIARGRRICVIVRMLEALEAEIEWIRRMS